MSEEWTPEPWRSREGEVRLTFTATGREEEAGSVVGVGLGPELAWEDLPAISDETSATATLRPGGVGVGAAGPGIELVLQYSSEALTTMTGLVFVGEKLHALIRRLRARRGRPTVKDSQTIAALAATEASRRYDDLAGMQLYDSRMIVGSSPPQWAGTDSRHVWASTFTHPTDGYLLVVFVSGSGMLLGFARVPLETYYDGTSWQMRSSEDVERLFFCEGL